MSPFLLWQSAACKQTDRRGGERLMDGGFGALAGLTLSGADEEIATQAVEGGSGRLDRKSDVPQESPPLGPREKAVVMSIVLDPHASVSIANENRKVDEVAGIARVGVGGPLQKAHAAALGVVAALSDILDKG